MRGGDRDATADERVRLFAALELPGPVRGALAAWRKAVLGDVSGLRLPSADHLHVTLCFLGWMAAVDIEAVLGACEAVAGASACELRLGKAIWLPRRRPRVIAVELEDPDGDLARVQRALSDALQAGGWYEPETRPFLAHVTVARVAARQRVRERELEEPPAMPVLGSRVTLFRSRLSPGGARYEALGSVELGAASGVTSRSE
jgi:2'-5' RNA ligase